MIARTAIAITGTTQRGRRAFGSRRCPYRPGGNIVPAAVVDSPGTSGTRSEVCVTLCWPSIRCRTRRGQCLLRVPQINCCAASHRPERARSRLPLIVSWPRFVLRMRMLEVTDDKLRLMAVHAHPDDESSKGAAAMAKYIAEGVDVLVVTCTGGERGSVLNAKLDQPEIWENIAEIRRREMDLAREILGIKQAWLGFVDSGLP